MRTLAILCRSPRGSLLPVLGCRRHFYPRPSCHMKEIPRSRGHDVSDPDRADFSDVPFDETASVKKIRWHLPALLDAGGRKDAFPARHARPDRLQLLPRWKRRASGVTMKRLRVIILFAVTLILLVAVFFASR